MDNKLAIDLIKNLFRHIRSKHIRVCYHFVWERAAEGRIEVRFMGIEKPSGPLLDYDESLTWRGLNSNSG
jgi:hypothetical protein